MHKPPTTKVGDIYTNSRGQAVTIVEYVTSKKITVSYEDGTLQKTTHVNLKKGAFRHPIWGKIQRGDKFTNNSGDEVTVSKYTAHNNVEVLWEDGSVSSEYTSSLKDGCFSHPTKGKIFAGDVFTTTNGDVTVIEYRNANTVIVKFEDGEQVCVQAGNLRKGTVGHPKSTLQIGEKFTSNSGWNYTVVSYQDAWNVTVEFEDGSRQVTSAHSARNGGIKPLNQPSVENVGFFGQGKYVPGLKRDGNKADDRVYGFWVRLFSRCYNPVELNKSRNAKYRDVHVDTEWHNFQNFAEWAYQQPMVFEEDVELDKDLLSGLTKVYSKATCAILPAEINRFLIGQDKGKYYRGVHVIAPKTPNSSVGYIARCNTSEGNREYLGFYKTPKEAFYAYKKCKEDHAKNLAAKWRDKIDSRAYESLMNYTVEITD